MWTALRFPGQYLDPETDLFENWNRFYDPPAGVYLGHELMMDDLMWVQGELKAGRVPPAYAYANGNPIAGADPTGLATQIIITVDKEGMFIKGTHAAIRLDNAGEAEPVLFDPGGSYSVNGARGSGGFFEGDDAALGPFLAYQTSSGEEVRVYNFDTTPAEEREIATRFGYFSEGGPRDVMGGRCALTVSENIAGIGPFKEVKPTGYPSALNKQLSQAFLGQPVRPPRPRF